MGFHMTQRYICYISRSSFSLLAFFGVLSCSLIGESYSHDLPMISPFSKERKHHETSQFIKQEPLPHLLPKNKREKPKSIISKKKLFLSGPLHLKSSLAKVTLSARERHPRGSFWPRPQAPKALSVPSPPSYDAPQEASQKHPFSKEKRKKPETKHFLRPGALPHLDLIVPNLKSQDPSTSISPKRPHPPSGRAFCYGHKMNPPKQPKSKNAKKKTQHS